MERNSEQCSIPSYAVDPATVEATAEEVREFAERLAEDFDFWEELRSEVRLERFLRCDRSLRDYRGDKPGGER